MYMMNINMKKVIIALIFTLMLVLLSCTNKKEDNVVSFRTYQSTIPVIQATVNGVTGYYIIDSGASVTVLNTQFIRKYKYKIMETDVVIQGYGGSKKLYSVYDCVLKIQGKRFITNFTAQDLTNISNSAEMDIAGIIGSDILSSYDVIIDYKNNNLIF